MHGLFDHGSVFSVVQIIFHTGWAIACGMEVRYLRNERKTAWTRCNARLSERNRYWKTAGDYCDKKSCRCFNMRGKERGWDGAKLVSDWRRREGGSGTKHAVE